jgi:cytochrome P450
LHGKHIQPGEVVALSFGSANHDPSVFAEPEDCLLNRWPNPHLAFGAGVHLCLGAPVARLEMNLTLGAFAQRLPAYALAPGASVKWKMRGDRRGLQSLPVSLRS